MQGQVASASAPCATEVRAFQRLSAQGGCQQAVRAVAALGAKQLAQEAAQLEKGGAWSGGQVRGAPQLAAAACGAFKVGVCCLCPAV